MRYFIRSVVLLGVWWVSNSAAVAETKENHLETVETVLVHGYRLNSLGASIAAAEGVIGDAEIASRPLARTGDILEFVPGMVVTQHSGSGKANQYFLRGFNLDHGTDFNTSIDAMPVNMRTHGHGQGYTDLNFIIPEMVQEIRYQKGPYYAETGDFSAAGAAEFSLKSKLKHSQLTLTAGQEHYRRLMSATSLDALNGSVLLALEAQTYQGPWTDINENIHKTNLLARYAARLGEGNFSLTFMGYQNRWNSADQIPERAVTQGIIDRLGSLDKSVGGESARYSVSSQWQTLDWLVTAYAIASELELFSNFTYLLSDPVNGDQFAQVDQREIFGGAITHNWASSFRSKALTHKLGVEVRYDDIGEVALYQTRHRSRLETIRRDAVDEGSVGLFMQTELALNDALRAHLGVRHDYFLVDVNGEIIANNGTASDSLTHIKMGAGYSLSKNLEFYVNLGQGYHSNDARGATIKIDPVTSETVTPVDLLAQSAGMEVGAKFFEINRFALSGSIWYLALDSELLFVGDAGNTEASRASQRSGVEIASHYWFANGVSLDLEVALTHSRFSENQHQEGKYVDGSVPLVVSAGISYAPAKYGFNSSLRYRHFGARTLDSFASRTANSGTLVNLGIGYRWQQCALDFEILNAFNSNDHDIDYLYRSRLDHEPKEGIEDLHYHPFEPRSTRLKLAYYF